MNYTSDFGLRVPVASEEDPAARLCLLRITIPFPSSSGNIECGNPVLVHV